MVFLHRVFVVRACDVAPGVPKELEAQVARDDQVDVPGVASETQQELSCQVHSEDVQGRVRGLSVQDAVLDHAIEEVSYHVEYNQTVPVPVGHTVVLTCLLPCLFVVNWSCRMVFVSVPNAQKIKYLNINN